MKKLLVSGLLFILCLAVAGCNESAGIKKGDENTKTEQAVSAPGSVKPAAPAAVFETNGKGGLYFDDFLVAQEEFPGVTDYVMQGSLEPDFYYVLHYPQELGDRADTSVMSYVQRLAGEHLFNGGTPADEFFSGTFARSDALQAHEQALEQRIKEEGLSREEYDFGREERIYPIFIDYAITDAPKVITVNFKIWSYGGGAHPNWSYSALSLDKATGRPVTIEQLFSGPGSLEKTYTWLNTTKDVAYYKQYVSETVAPAVKRTNLVLDSADLMQDALEMNRMIFSPEGLEVLFSPYEQGSYVMGDIRAPIPREIFDTLGINKSYWEE